MINALKKWVGKIAVEALQQPKDDGATRSHRMTDMLSDAGAMTVVFQIDNGYLVRNIRPNNIISTGSGHGFTYCADHQAIADHIVSSAMKGKLGVQQEMFPPEQARKQVNVIRKPQAAGLVGAQQATSF